MYLGRYQQGDQLPLKCLCVNAAGVPTMPDNVPSFKFFTPAGALYTGFGTNGLLPPMDRYGTTALFGVAFPVGAAFATTGGWRVVYTWSIGTFTGLSEDTFEIVPGGNPSGNVISMYYYQRPQADFIVIQTDGDAQVLVGEGEIRAGRNPRL